jgi:hypothetical protein
VESQKYFVPIMKLDKLIDWLGKHWFIPFFQSLWLHFKKWVKRNPRLMM